MAFKRHLWFPLLVGAAGVLFVFASGCCRCMCRSHDGRGGGPHGWGDERGPRGRRGDEMADHLAKELDLNDGQKTKLHAIKETLEAGRMDFANGHAGIFEVLAAEAKAEKLDTAKLNGLFAEKEAKIKSMHETLVRQIAEFHASLTPEQREKLSKNLDKMNGWQKEHPDRR